MRPQHIVERMAALALLFTACPQAAPPAPPSPGAPTCDAGECNTRGMEALARARTQEALVLLDRACALGHAVGCSNLAGLHRGGAGELGDPSRAPGLYERSCTLGFAEACTALGSIHAEGKLVASDLTRARSMYQQACELRDAYGCFTAGLFHSEGRGGARDAAAAGELFGQACELGHATGCLNAGVLLFRERGAKPGDNERAAAFFGRACEGQQPAGCMRLALATVQGVGTSADVKVARDLFQRACQAGEADGCAAAEQLAAGKGRVGQAIALTSSAPSLAIQGLQVHDLVCHMPELGPMALAEAVEGLAAHKAELDACAPQGAAPAVAWTWSTGRATKVKVDGGGPRVEACVRKVVQRARAELRGVCQASLEIGEASGARKMLAEQRSPGDGSAAKRRPSPAAH